MPADDEWLVDFPTLGDLWEAWVRQHCPIPDGFQRGEPMTWSDWQFWCAANFGRIRARLKWAGTPLRNQAFTFRRGQVVGPQKTGKGPWAASMVLIQAVGPSEFDGWAEAGEYYRCSDNGCDCGWTYQYLDGEPKGRRHPSPLIQLSAYSEDQVENTYRPLRSMITMGPLRWLLADRDGFVRILGGIGGDAADRIDVVTANANSRVGQPISFALQDETGLWTASNRLVGVADNQRRGLAGMGGRSLETTNAWNAAEASVAQTTYEGTATDVFKFFRRPPKSWKWESAADRRMILEYVYKGSPWVDLDSIEAEAAELGKRDPDQVKRFFGNIVTYGQGSWLPGDLWEDAYAGVAT
ncbi:MAG: terminase [Corynebacterium provencense]|jgi:hypothetical protein|uniref:terminase n=1 Tax=Corynebacterium provencense TaxID=1737425 RepID=UPI002989A0B4|nr:terminase [Corynebacterium provencense]